MNDKLFKYLNVHTKHSQHTFGRGSFSYSPAVTLSALLELDLFCRTETCTNVHSIVCAFTAYNEMKTEHDDDDHSTPIPLFPDIKDSEE